MQNWEWKSVFNWKSIKQKLQLHMSVTYVQKDLKIQTLIKQLLTNYQIFKKLPQISHIRKSHIFKSMIGIF